MLDRISSFFTKRKKSRNSSDASSGACSPTSPPSTSGSPGLCEEEDGLKTPTPSRKDGPWGRAAGGDTLSRSSTPSGISLTTTEAELPFADSDSSGRGSVREVYVDGFGKTKKEGNSGRVTPTTPITELNSGIGFAESVVEEVNKKLHVQLEERILTDSEGHREESPVSATTLMTFVVPSSQTPDSPRSPNLTSISLTSKKTSVKVGGNGHSSSLTGIRLGSQSSAPTAADAVHQVTRTPSPEKGEERPRSDSPVQLHRAIWVETHLGEEDWEGEEVMREEQQEGEGERADSPPVLAVPVTVIPEEEPVSRSPADSPAPPTEGFLSGTASPSAESAGECLGDSPHPQEPGAAADLKKSLSEKRRAKENRVTRKTVNLPSKHRLQERSVALDTETETDSTAETSPTPQATQ